MFFPFIIPPFFPLLLIGNDIRYLLLSDLNGKGISLRETLSVSKSIQSVCFTIISNCSDV